jgi:uncharacterized caspase-like protein
VKLGPAGISQVILSIAILISGSFSAVAEKRVALIIGNAAYTGIAPLAKPINDARKVAEIVKGLGFEVILATDAKHNDLSRLTERFRQAVKDADVGFFYYSGHGFQTNRVAQQHPVNHIVPVDFKVDDGDAVRSTLPLDAVLDTLKRDVRVGFVFMDACRNDPQLAAAALRHARSTTRAVSIARGFSPVDVSATPKSRAKLSVGKGPAGLLIAYATDPGNVAFEGDKGTLSPFTSALAKHLATPGISIAEAMGRVSAEVATETQGQQTPWSVASLTAGTYQFLPKSAEPDAARRATAPSTNGSRARSNTSRAPARTSRAPSVASKSSRAPARSSLPPNVGFGVGSGL